MFGIPESIFIPFASILGTVLLGVVVALGQRWGKSQPTPAERTYEVAGALVDSEAIRLVAAAIEANTMEAIEGRHQMRRAVECMTKFVTAIDNGAGEVEELRRAVGDLANQIARKH